MKLICDCGNEMEFRDSGEEDHFYDNDKFDISTGYGGEIEISCEHCKKYILVFRGKSFKELDGGK